MRGFEVILSCELEVVNVDEHCLCANCKRIFPKEDCEIHEFCGGFTCNECAMKGQFTCCLQVCMESAEIEGERILELSQGEAA